MSFNYHMHDLLDLVESYKIMNEKEKTDWSLMANLPTVKFNQVFAKRNLSKKN